MGLITIVNQAWDWLTIVISPMLVDNRVISPMFGWQYSDQSYVWLTIE
jgi:hypothetical protein